MCQLSALPKAPTILSMSMPCRNKNQKSGTVTYLQQGANDDQQTFSQTELHYSQHVTGPAY